MIGRMLGPYQVLSKLGEGGMGEVYRATDTNLNRQVAIKVLPEALAHDTERLARFDREARTLASLNHQNIAQIYGVEKVDGQTAIVMELVEGPTLADRIARGPVAGDEALPIARQIAEALEAAHEREIVHRDLKPLNIKVREDGTVKVLDFGLAKALSPEAGGVTADVANSPTITSPVMTRQGVILGTAPYMAPEQARGKPIDKRADIWAFGCVLFEMLTGHRPFDGRDATEVLARVLERDPPLDDLPPSTTPATRQLVRRCLEKDPRQRLRDIGEARIAIDHASQEFRRPPQLEQHQMSRWMRHAGLLAAGAVLASFVIWLLGGGREAPAGEALRLTVALPAGQQLVQPAMAPLDLSPDGRLLVYSASSASEGGEASLYLRSLDTFEPVKVPNTLGGHSPFFSLDGLWIGFQQGNALKKVRVSGGLPVSLTEGALLLGASWGPDDTIVFSDATGTGLWQVSAEGGERRALTNPGGSMEHGHRFPYQLPDGSGVLFNVDGPTQSQLAFLPAGESEWRTVATSPSRFGGMRYTASGHLVYGQAGQLLAAPFDLTSSTFTGPAVPVVEAVARNTASDIAFFAVADNGTLAYATGGGDSRSRLMWIAGDGTVTTAVPGAGPFGPPRLSPDGAEVAVPTRVRGEASVWSYDVARGVGTPLTTGDENDGVGPYDPVVWMPDSERVTIALNGDLYTVRADGEGSTLRLLQRAGRLRPFDWSADGRFLLFGEQGSETQADIWVFSPADDSARPVLAGEANEDWARFSSNGDWIAYVSDETGRDEVYVQAFGTTGRRVRVSSAGGAHPVWGSGDETLVYRRPVPSPGLIEVALTLGPTIVVGEERTVIDGRVGLQGFDISSDDRLLVPSDVVMSGAVSDIRVAVDWLDELRRLVPAN